MTVGWLGPSTRHVATLAATGSTRNWVANNSFDDPPSPSSWNDHSGAWRLKVFTCLSLQGATPDTGDTTPDTCDGTPDTGDSTPATPTWLHR